MEFHLLCLLFVIAATHAHCPVGSYGNQCTFICGKCEGNSACDPDTGQCPSSSCQSGWHTSYCNISYPVLRDPPVLRNRTENTINICWQRWTPTNGDGQGKPVSYVLQIKTMDGSQWKTIKQFRADEWSEQNDGFQETITDIKPELDYEVRVIILDESRIAQWNGVPILQVTKLREGNSKNDKDKITIKIDNNSDEEKDDWTYYLIWLGVAAGCGFIIATFIALGLEFRRRRKLRKQAIENGMLELSENYINNSRMGIDNAALVTLRRDAEAKRKVEQNANDKIKSHQGWKEAIPGLSRATAPESWYTDWGHDSRIYENDYKR